MRGFINTLIAILFLVVIFVTGKVANIVGAVDVLKSIGYEKATVEMLNDLSSNEVKKLVEEKKFIEVDGVYYYVQ